MSNLRRQKTVVCKSKTKQAHVNTPYKLGPINDQILQKKQLVLKEIWFPMFL